MSLIDRQKSIELNDLVFEFFINLQKEHDLSHEEVMCLVITFRDFLIVRMAHTTADRLKTRIGE